ncbi:protein SSUH2 [Carex littledalei]|uniref:Protein SSUH2 n=1 Tax=Carex littledalei TaxID=544730 RepID=A0A833RK37_9POAL|nr:protein SSUH2 [Carex littledalei]
MATASSYGFLTTNNRSFPWQIISMKSRLFTPPTTARASFKTVAAGCKTCRGKGAIECPGCKGTGRNKKNGNMFERWK